MQKRIAATLALFIGLAASALAVVPTRLAEALQKDQAEQGRWAYTETTETRNAKGKLKETIVVRYDPSKAYAEQYAVLSVNGKPPAGWKAREYRERGEKEAAQREKAAAAAETCSKGQIPIEFEEEKGVADLEAAWVVSESDRFVTYSVPVRSREASEFPFELMDVRLKIDKAAEAMAETRVEMLAPVRVNWLVRVKEVRLEASYAPASTDQPPLVTKVQVGAKAKVAGINLEEHVSVVRSDFKRVKPYDERFFVKNGPLKTLGTFGCR